MSSPVTRFFLPVLGCLKLQPVEVAAEARLHCCRVGVAALGPGIQAAALHGARARAVFMFFHAWGEHRKRNIS